MNHNEMCLKLQGTTCMADLASRLLVPSPSLSLSARTAHNSLVPMEANPRARYARVQLPRVVGLPWANSTFPMLVHDPDDCVWISRSLLHARKWEPNIVAEAIHAMRSSPMGELFLDIGSNIGTYALSVAAAGFAAVAFEPMRYNTELLSGSIALNPGFERRISLFKTAVAAEEPAQEQLMCIRPAADKARARNGGNGQLVPLSSCAVGEQARTERVPVRRTRDERNLRLGRRALTQRAAGPLLRCTRWTPPCAAAARCATPAFSPPRLTSRDTRPTRSAARRASSVGSARHASSFSSASLGAQPLGHGLCHEFDACTGRYDDGMAKEAGVVPSSAPDAA